MKEQQMTTRFIIDRYKTDDLYIYMVPECQMCRLQKGDRIRLRKYMRGFLFNDLEGWEAVVTEVSSFELNWSDHEDTGMFAYDTDSVIPMQIVHIIIESHTLS